MTRKKRGYVCDVCGYDAPAWFGRCPSCETWDSAKSFSSLEIPEKAPEGLFLPLENIDTFDHERISTGFFELDRALGGGIVAGSSVLFSGEPGVGKSTCVLQIASSIASSGRDVLYITGEESARQIKLRANRLGLKNGNHIHVSPSSEIDYLRTADLSGYTLIVLDSLQTVRLAEIPSLPGSVTQVRECANLVISRSKKEEIPSLLIGHITKEGLIAGPKLIEHLADTVLSFEDTARGLRFIRALKNRFGPADEVAVFEMRSDGLSEVQDLSGITVQEFMPAPGNVITAVVEGSRAFLVEIQSLVSKPLYSSPRRVTSGVSIDRMLLVAGVLTKRAGIPLDTLDIYVNVAGGLSLDDTGIDLAVAVSLVSSFLDKPVPDKACVFGEIGLDGSIRKVSHMSRRTERAEISGFPNTISPEGRVLTRDISELLKIFGGVISERK